MYTSLGFFNNLKGQGHGIDITIVQFLPQMDEKLDKSMMKHVKWMKNHASFAL